jgi:hypothetical protein
MSKDDFFNTSALGRSLAPLRSILPFELCLFPENTAGLPLIYNSVIEATKNDPSILIFLHDDVYICDFLWLRSVFQGLKKFDLLGLAGNKRRLSRQPSWAFIDEEFTWDEGQNLSGIIGHGSGIPDYNISAFGEPGQAVKLLDGVLLACQSQTLHAHDIRFDERFDFHFYDLDLCRQLESQAIKNGYMANFSHPREWGWALAPLHGETVMKSISRSGVVDVCHLNNACGKAACGALAAGRTRPTLDTPATC